MEGVVSLNEALGFNSELELFDIASGGSHGSSGGRAACGMAWMCGSCFSDSNSMPTGGDLIGEGEFEGSRLSSRIVVRCSPRFAPLRRSWGVSEDKGGHEGVEMRVWR